MNVKGINLIWIVVNDIKKAIAFYTDTVGLKLEEFNEEYKWAELVGPEGGSRLGIAEKSDKESVQPGQNGVITITVKDIVTARKEFADKGTHLQGEITEIPGVVKMQTVLDSDGNRFQLVEMIS